MPIPPPTTSSRGGIYIASKTAHGPDWVAMRDEKWPIISTWIDECGVGETSDWPDLWTRCIQEASTCAVLVVISREGDNALKGALAEVGAALSQGIPVFATGIDEYSIKAHPGIRVYETEDDVFAAALYFLDNFEPDNTEYSQQLSIRANLRVALAKPLPEYKFSVNWEDFDPWRDVIRNIYGGYTQKSDDMFIAALEAVQNHEFETFRETWGFAGEFALYVLAGHGLTEYGTSPRSGWPDPQVDDMWTELIQKWKDYSQIAWSDD